MAVLMQGGDVAVVGGTNGSIRMLQEILAERTDAKGAMSEEW